MLAHRARAPLGALLSIPLLLGVGCGERAEPHVDEVHDTAPVPAHIADRDVDAVLDVRCGCAIEGIGTCGNYATIDGVPVPIEGLDLGPMEWCGEDGARAHLVGRVEGGVLVARSLERQE